MENTCFTPPIFFGDPQAHRTPLYPEPPFRLFPLYPGTYDPGGDGSDATDLAKRGRLKNDDRPLF